MIFKHIHRTNKNKTHKLTKNNIIITIDLNSMDIQLDERRSMPIDARYPPDKFKTNENQNMTVFKCPPVTNQSTLS